jgi:hypothetical protein
MTSWREVSQLANDLFPPSNCWITLLLVTAEDLLLTRMASLTVFAHFCWGSGGGGGGVELAGRGGIYSVSRVVAATTTIVVGAAVASSPTAARGRGRSERRYLLSAQAFFCLLLCAHFLSLADNHPGWCDEGGAAAGAAILGMKLTFLLYYAPHTAHGPSYSCPCTPGRAPRGRW